MTKLKPLIVIGGGEHARVVIEVARSEPTSWVVAGFVDVKPCQETAARFGLRQFYSDEAAWNENASFLVGVGLEGSGSKRAELVDRYDAARVRWGTLVHSNAWVSPTAVLNDGAVVMAGVIINAGAVIGRHAIVNSGALVEHDVRIGEFVVVGPRVSIGGGVIIGAHACFGIGCCIRDHITIGSGATVAMGAVVVRSISANSRVMGNPAREK